MAQDKHGAAKFSDSHKKCAFLSPYFLIHIHFHKKSPEKSSILDIYKPALFRYNIGVGSRGRNNPRFFLLPSRTARLSQQPAEYQAHDILPPRLRERAFSFFIASRSGIATCLIFADFHQFISSAYGNPEAVIRRNRRSPIAGHLSDG